MRCAFPPSHSPIKSKYSMENRVSISTNRKNPHPFWEFLILALGCGLIAVITRSPGCRRSVIYLSVTSNPRRTCTERISFEGGAGKGEQNRYRTTEDNFREDHFGLIRLFEEHGQQILSLEVIDLDGKKVMTELTRSIASGNLNCAKDERFSTLYGG
jgi:hypothetical protein